MDWKSRFDKQPAEKFDLPFNRVQVSDCKTTVHLFKDKNHVMSMSVHQFLRFLDGIEQEGLQFDRKGLENLVGITEAQTSPA